MAVKKQISIRVSDLTAQQIDDLITKWGMNQTEVIALAIDRVHRDAVETEPPKRKG